MKKGEEAERGGEDHHQFLIGHLAACASRASPAMGKEKNLNTRDLRAWQKRLQDRQRQLAFRDLDDLDTFNQVKNKWTVADYSFQQRFQSLPSVIPPSPIPGSPPLDSLAPLSPSPSPSNSLAPPSLSLSLSPSPNSLAPPPLSLSPSPSPSPSPSLAPLPLFVSPAQEREKRKREPAKKKESRGGARLFGGGTINFSSSSPPSTVNLVAPPPSQSASSSSSSSCSPSDCPSHFLSVATRPSNLYKNRSNMGLPTDLGVVPFYDGEYINASKFEREGTVYLASQHPTIATLFSYWKMVMVEKPGVMVMLNGCEYKKEMKSGFVFEGARPLIRYFPDIFYQKNSKREEDQEENELNNPRRKKDQKGEKLFVLHSGGGGEGGGEVIEISRGDVHFLSVDGEYKYLGEGEEWGEEEGGTTKGLLVSELKIVNYREGEGEGGKREECKLWHVFCDFWKDQEVVEEDNFCFLWEVVDALEQYPLGGGGEKGLGERGEGGEPEKREEGDSSEEEGGKELGSSQTFLRSLSVVEFERRERGRDKGGEGKEKEKKGEIENGKTGGIEEKREKRKMLVHCTGGIGRTGTFIVVDIAAREFPQKNGKGDLSVEEIIAFLRSQRSHVVSHPSQFAFCHSAVVALCRRNAIEGVGL